MGKKGSTGKQERGMQEAGRAGHWRSEESESVTQVGRGSGSRWGDCLNQSASCSQLYLALGRRQEGLTSPGEELRIISVAKHATMNLHL